MPLLLHHAGKSYSIKHQLGSTIHEPLTENDLAALIRAGEQARVCEYFIRPTIAVVSKYVIFALKRKDDLLSEALLTLTETVKGLIDGDKPKTTIVSHIISCIHGCCANFIRMERSFGVGYTAKKYREKKGLPPKPKCSSRCISDLNVVQQKDQYENIDTLDWLLSFAESDIQRNLLKLRLEGYTFAEIGNQLEFSTGHMQQEFERLADKIRHSPEVENGDFPSLPAKRKNCGSVK